MADEQNKPKNQSSDAVEAPRAIEKFIDTTLPSLPPIPEKLLQKLSEPPCACKYPTAQDLMSWQITMGELARFHEVRRHQLPEGVLQAYNAMNEMGLDPRDPMFMFNMATRYKKNTDHRDEFDIAHPDVKLIQAGRTQGKSVPFHKVPRIIMVTTPGTDHVEEMVKSLERQPWEFVAHMPEEGPLPPVEVNLPGSFVEQPPVWNGTVENQLMEESIKAMGISPEMLNSQHATPSVIEFSKRWQAMMRQTGKSQMAQAVSNQILKLILMGTAMGYKKTRVFGGSMRNKRRHHYVALVKKEYVKSLQTFQNTGHPVMWPSDIKFSEPDENGMVNLDVTFEFTPDPKLSEAMKDWLVPNTTPTGMQGEFAPRMMLDANGKLDMMTVDLVNVSAVNKG